MSLCAEAGERSGNPHPGTGRLGALLLPPVSLCPRDLSLEADQFVHFARRAAVSDHQPPNYVCDRYSRLSSTSGLHLRTLAKILHSKRDAPVANAV
jgi:hypothetical protein